MLGLIIWDFNALMMSCMVAGQHITWTSVPVPNAPACRALQQGDLASVLDDFTDIFLEPTGLPPPRVHDHHILLVDGAQPVAVRPYYCPQLQKDELEHHVEAMLWQGIIRLSTSALSPVLLVKNIP